MFFIGHGRGGGEPGYNSLTLIIVLWVCYSGQGAFRLHLGYGHHIIPFRVRRVWTHLHAVECSGEGRHLLPSFLLGLDVLFRQRIFLACAAVHKALAGKEPFAGERPSEGLHAGELSLRLDALLVLLDRVVADVPAVLVPTPLVGPGFVDLTAAQWAVRLVDLLPQLLLRLLGQVAVLFGRGAEPVGVCRLFYCREVVQTTELFAFFVVRWPSQVVDGLGALVNGLGLRKVFLLCCLRMSAKPVPIPHFADN